MSSPVTDLETVDLSITNTEIPSLKPYIDPLPLKIPTSTVVQVTPDKPLFWWNEAIMLIPHEMIRVEMLRVTRTINYLSLDCHLLAGTRWRLSRFNDYINGFLKDMIHEHHEIEEKILVHHYAALGEDLEKSKMGGNLSNDHAELLSSLDDFCENIQKLASNKSIIEESEIMTLVYKWQLLNQLLLTHFMEEEKMWPDVFLRHGYPEAQKLLKKIHKSQKGDPRGFGSMIQSLGLPIAHSKIDQGWTSGRMEYHPMTKLLLNDFQTIPWVVRNCCCILPKFVAQYEHLKTSLISIATMTDDDHEIGPNPACGPCCTIS